MSGDFFVVVAAASCLLKYLNFVVHHDADLTGTFRDEEKITIAGKVLAEVDKWMERFDCLVVGPGLGRDSFLLVSF